MFITELLNLKNFIAIFIFICLTLSVSAQRRVDFGIALGVSNYLGDIGGKEKTRRDFIADIKMSKTRWNAGGFVRFRWMPRISLKASLDYLRIEGDDKLSSNPARNARNLSFRNDLIDLGATSEFFFFEDNDIGNTYFNATSFRAYVFGGVGCVYSNPKALYNGSWVNLRPLQTEGVKYKAFVLNVPVGVGFYFTFKKKHRIGFEYNFRTTFTDYLDDIHAGWADPSTLTPTGLALSNRTVELTDLDPGFAKNFGYNPVENPTNLRGNNKHRDSYMTLNISYSYVLRGKPSFYKGYYKSTTGGFFGRPGKSRKVRAKF